MMMIYLRARRKPWVISDGFASLFLTRSVSLVRTRQVMTCVPLPPPRREVGSSTGTLTKINSDAGTPVSKAKWQARSDTPGRGPNADCSGQEHLFTATDHDKKVSATM